MPNVTVAMTTWAVENVGATYHPLHLLGDLVVVGQVVVERSVRPVAAVVTHRVRPVTIHLGDQRLLLFLTRANKHTQEHTRLAFVLEVLRWLKRQMMTTESRL